MKNVIFFVCDGLPYDITIDMKNHPSPMRFLQQVKKNATVCSKAYSQAPYTEGAVMGLIYGRDPLEEGGYFSGMQEWDNSIFSLFYNNGYEIFTSYFGSFTPPELLLKGKYVYPENYFSPFFSRYLRGKLDYFKNIYDSCQLNDIDFEFISRCLDTHFKSMLLWQSEEAILNDSSSFVIPCENRDQISKEEIFQWKQRLEQEFKLYVRNKKEYIGCLFENYSNHFLLKSCDLSSLAIRSDLIAQRRYVRSKYASLFRKLNRINKKVFLRSKLNTANTIISSFKRGKKVGFEHCYRYFQCFKKFNVSKMVDENLKQICASAKGLVKSLSKWLEINSSSQKPFFAYLHFDEFHRPLSFYSHDICDKNYIDKEFELISKYAENLKKNYNGDVVFDSSALYLDEAAKELFDELKRLDKFENTIIVITSDHGSSNFGENIRFTVTNNFYDEQYHIPLIITGLTDRTAIDSYVNSKDIPFTILEECGIHCPDSFTGSNFFREKKFETYAEYMGSGVPDYQRKNILFRYKNDDICYVISQPSNSVEKDAKILEFYDLKKDPKQLKNISNRINNNFKESLIHKYQDRKIYLNSNFVSWINKHEDKNKK